MAITQFAMVEELASLIKDNLSCKHLVLSTEEALISFLEEDASPEGILELQPMSPYQRLLLHRLADIYGFAHASVGEGDDRHLVLQRCPETAIPSILVSDILWQEDEYQAPMPSHHILRRKEAAEPCDRSLYMPVLDQHNSELKMNETFPSSMTLEEREAAYQAARERIFSMHEVDEKEVAPKSRNIPVVARRMIAHALGQRNLSVPPDSISNKCEDNETTDEPPKEDPNSTLEVKGETITRHDTCKKKVCGKIISSTPRNDHVTEKKGSMSGKPCDNKNLEKEQIGAAKRMFAQALGRPSMKGNHGTHRKPSGGDLSSLLRYDKTR